MDLPGKPKSQTSHLSYNPAEWKGFSFAHGDFALHVPSSSVAMIPTEMATLMRGQTPLPQWPSAIKQQFQDFAAAHLANWHPEATSAPKVNIHSIALNVAQACNMRCNYCFAGDGDYGKASLMTEEVGKRTVDFFARDQKRLHLIFFGGEPLMNFALIQKLVAYAKEEKFKGITFTYSITTNGTLLTSKHLEFFKEHQFIVNWSYDGKGLQEKQRPLAIPPPRAIQKSTSSEPMLQEKLEKFHEQLSNLRGLQLRSTVMKENLGNLEEAILHTLTSHQYRFLMGYHATPMRSLAFGPKDVEKLGAIYHSVITRLYEDDNLEALLRFEPLRAHLGKIKRGNTKQMFCLAGVNYLSVSSTGSFYLCHRFTEDESEKVGDLEQGLLLDKLNTFANHRAVKHEPCNSCWMREWCGGGCFHENKAANKTPFAPDPMFCRLQDLEMSKAMELYTQLVIQKKPELAKI